ncbi:hypothetical protein MMC17_004325 [Xylographa soralifera]|nr:hypothetical protein [Xylographa soralifera]
MIRASLVVFSSKPYLTVGEKIIIGNETNRGSEINNSLRVQGRSKVRSERNLRLAGRMLVIAEVATVESDDELVNPLAKSHKLASSELWQYLCSEAKSPNGTLNGVWDPKYNGDMENDGNIGKHEASNGVTQHIHPSSVEAAQSFPEQPHDQRGAAKDEEQEWDEWETKRITGKRERGGCIKYEMQWKSTW